MAMIKCPECRKKISSNATVCPNCGMPLDSAQANNNFKKPKSNKKLIVIAILLILMVIGAVSGDKEDKTSETTTETVTESINNSETTSETESTAVVLTEKEQYILNAQYYVTMHMVTIGITMVTVALEPLFAKLFKKINTSIEVEGNGDLGTIDIADGE